MAVTDDAGHVVLNLDRRDRFVRSVLKERYGQSQERWPVAEANAALGLACDAAGCVLNRNDTRVTLALSAAALAEDCGVTAIIIAPTQFADDCRGSFVIDRGNLFREGAHALYLSDGRVRVESVEDLTGDRIWSRQPQRRTRPVIPEVSRSEDFDNTLSADQ